MTSAKSGPKEKNPGKKVVGYGWCGTYHGSGEHRLGWQLSEYISHKQESPLNENQRKALGLISNRHFADSDMWRVKVTIEPVKNKGGKYIVKRFKSSHA
jgi:hypothetical protein